MTACGEPVPIEPGGPCEQESVAVVRMSLHGLPGEYDAFPCGDHLAYWREHWPESLLSVAPLAPGAPPRLSRTEYALALAETAALRAACTRRQVGAAILDGHGRVVALGYNGTGPGEVHCTDGGCPRGAYSHEQVPANLGNGGHTVPCVGLHAERNAADWALAHGADPADCLVAVAVPTGPCPECAASLVEQGWREVVWPGGGWTARQNPGSTPPPPH